MASARSAADVERGANIDELRHLAVGSWVVRESLGERPEEKDRILDLIVRGRQLWNEVPSAEVIYNREVLFQRGLEQRGDVVGDYEIEPGVRLVDTSAEQRLEMALAWSNELQEGRLAYMGLEEAIP